MKTLTLFLVVTFSAAGYGKNIPGPFWYSLSEKILTETTQFFSSNDTPKPVVKVKAKKIKVSTPLKCQPKKSTILENPFPVVTKKAVTPDAES